MKAALFQSSFGQSRSLEVNPQLSCTSFFLQRFTDLFAKTHRSQRNPSNPPVSITSQRRSRLGKKKGKTVLHQTTRCAKVGTPSSRDSRSSAKTKWRCQPPTGSNTSKRRPYFSQVLPILCSVFDPAFQVCVEVRLTSRKTLLTSSFTNCQGNL